MSDEKEEPKKKTPKAKERQLPEGATHITDTDEGFLYHKGDGVVRYRDNKTHQWLMNPKRKVAEHPSQKGLVDENEED